MLPELSNTYPDYLETEVTLYDYPVNKYWMAWLLENPSSV